MTRGVTELSVFIMEQTERHVLEKTKFLNLHISLMKEATRWSRLFTTLKENLA